ncbi:MAG: zinc ribbon domain-containing protein [Gemmatimonadetes bacterium]|nr:zinc ribbon domain-containing protein [Gemmatimonadota bacterium]
MTGAMRCSTCGERLAADDDRCPTCGAAVSTALRRTVAVRRCPRCHYAGEGVGYFRRPGHVALLVCLSLFTYGFGGLAYWLMRRRHLVCPNCGFGWENASRLLAGADREPPRVVPSMTGEERASALPSSGIKRRVLGTVAILLGAFLIMMGIVEFEAALVAVGSVAGAGGSGTFYWGWKALQERRAALTQGLQRRVLRLATQKGGTLTVTEVAAELDLSMPAAEKVLVAMDDGFRVRSDITKEGILLYEFPEVQHRGRLEPGAGG